MKRNNNIYNLEKKNAVYAQKRFEKHERGNTTTASYNRSYGPNDFPRFNRFGPRRDARSAVDHADIIVRMHNRYIK